MLTLNDLEEGEESDGAAADGYVPKEPLIARVGDLFLVPYASNIIFTVCNLLRSSLRSNPL